MVEDVGLIDRGDYFSKHRPEPLPGQVLDMKGLTVGREVVVNKQGKDSTTVKILTNPRVVKSLPGRWVTVGGELNGRPFTLDISLADYGVIPYEGSRMWNTFTCLRDPEIPLGGAPDNVLELKPRNKGVI